MSVLKQSEIIQIKIPNKPYNIPDKKTTWHDYGYGTFKKDSNWDELFDEIEFNRNDNII
jgi:hypothetical protein